LGSRQGLRENTGKLMLSVDIHYFNEMGSLLVSDKMKLDIDVLRSLMMSRIMD
jgi:hypothetical protein